MAERGQGRITTFDKIVQVSDGLRIPGTLLGLAPRHWERSAYELSATVSGQVTGVADNGDEAVLRRDFFKASAIGAGLVLGLPELASIKIGERIGPEVPTQLRRRTARLRRLDDLLGGGDTYRVYLGEYHRTKVLLREGTYTEATGKALLSVLAEQAQQAGWAAFDAGNHTEARSLYEASHQAALEAQDASLAGNALIFLAYMDVDTNPQTAVSVAVEGCRTAGPEAPAGVRTLLYERLAWAYAVTGNATETERALSTAEAALSELGSARQPDWASWVDQSELQIMTGRCWTQLRRPLRAAPVLEDVLARFDDAHARDKALYSSWLAESYLAAGEVEQAAEVAGQVLGLSAGVASVRPRQRITPVLRELAAHGDLPQVAEVLDMASA
jgi:tetratricopeptide (TPR) repeat protein